MSYRLAILLACVCATTACINAPPFQGISDDGGTGDGSSGNNDGMSSSGLEQWTHLKAAAPGSLDHFGTAIAISGTGTTLAVGAPDEDGPGADDKLSSGAVNVFIATGDVWQHQKYVRAGDAAPGDQFGAAVALSADGNTLVVGAPGRVDNNNGSNAGLVYVFVRNGAAWTEQAALQTPSPDAGDKLGTSVALSSDGNVLVAGAPFDDNDGATAPDAGLAYVFRRAFSTTWSSGVGLAASNPSGGDSFGLSVAISGDGATVAVGAPAEDSMTTGINTTPDEGTTGSGAVYVYRYSGTWNQTAYVKPTNTTTNEAFGSAVALSSNAYVLVVGATGDGSPATGVDGAQTGTLAQAGAVFVFERTGDEWTTTTTTYVKASNTDQFDQFGKSVSVTRNGTMILVGAPGEASKAMAINGDQADNSMASAGAAYLFRKSTQWQQTAYIKASTTVAGDLFGGAVALADLVSTFAIGASGEGTSGDDSGAAYVFRDPE